MARSLFGWINYASVGALAAGSAASGMSIGSGWASDQGSASTAWQTGTGVVTSAAGAWATIDAGATSTWRAFLLARTNLSSAATVRWRVGPTEAINEEVRIVDVRFDTGSFVAPTGWSFSRASANGGYINSAGQYAVAGANTLRVTYDPLTLACLGAIAEAQRTNSIRNPRGEGAVAGSPGAVPTNWTAGNVAALGMTTTVTASTSDNGFPCGVLRIFGTPTSSGTCWLAFEAINQIAATVGQVWALSAYLKIIAGSAANTTWQMQVLEYDAGPALLNTQSQTISPSTLPYGQSRQEFIFTVGQATTATIRPRVGIAVTSGQAVDVTFEITPQCELGGKSSTLILPPVASPGAATRSADAGSISGLSLTGAAGITGFADATLSAGAAGGAIMGLVPVSGTFADSVYASTTATQASLTILDSVHGNWTPPSSIAITDGAADRHAWSIGPAGAALSVNGSTVTTAAGTGQYPGTYTTLGVLGAPWSGPGVAVEVGIYRRISVFAKQLTNGQLKALSGTGSTLDATAATYDSGTVSAGIVAGIGQSVIVAPADASGRYARVDINDPANPDGFINVPLAFAGPVWVPNVGADWQSAIGRDARIDEVQSIGGQEWPVMRWARRRHVVQLAAVTSSEVWASYMALDLTARMGGNVAYIPDTASADIAREAIFGRMQPLSDLGYTDRSVNLRSVRMSITERL